MTNMRMTCVIIPGVLLLAMGTAFARATEYTYQTPLKHEGRSLHPFGISNDGNIVGVMPVQGEDAKQGFLLSNGSLTPVRIGHYSTFLTAINPSGTACVGWYYDDTRDQQRSFEYRISDGSIRYLPDLGGPGADTIAEDITDSGLIVGDNRLRGTAIREQGFILDGEGVRFFHVPGAIYTSLTGVNNSGQMVGSYWSGVTNTPNSQVLLDGDTLTHLTIPPSLRSADVTDINNMGQIIGWGYPEPLGSEAVGFVLEGDDYHYVRLPGDTGDYLSSLLEGINDSGQIAGHTLDNTHGFIATPRNAIPEPSSLALLLAGVPLAWVRRRKA